MRDNSFLYFDLDTNQTDSDLLAHHNNNFFSEFEFLNINDQPQTSDSYYSILDKVFQVSNSFLLHTDFKGTIKNSLSISEQQLFNSKRISIGDNILDIFNPSAKEQVLHNIYVAIKNKSVRTIDVSLTKNITEHIYELIIIPSIGKELLFYFQQVTDKRKIEDSLKKSDELLKSIWNNSFDGMRLTDKNGIVIAVNNAYCKMMGIKAEELVGKYYKEIYHCNKKDSERIGNAVWKKSITEYSESEIRLKSGKNITVTIMNTLVKDVFSKHNPKLPDQHLLFSVFRDLTERIRNENKLREMEKLSVFGKMSAYLAHQIKTPIATIKMNLDLLEKSQVIAQEKIRSYKIISEEIDRLNKLIQNAFLFLRRSDNIEIDINLNELVSSIENFYELLINEKGIKFINETTVYKIRGDYQKLRMVFILLVENSIEAIKRKGYIKIKDENDKNGTYHSIFIEDSGEGIIDSSSIFETFYTTKSYGTGLGLSIVKNLLSEIGGTLKLISTEKGKTIFKVTLPIKERDHGKNINH